MRKLAMPRIVTSRLLVVMLAAMIAVSAWFGGSVAVRAAEPTSAAAATDDQRYDVRLRELETRVNTLKERIFRSKQRLMLLNERMHSGRTLDSKVVIRHSNELHGSWFRLEEVAYLLDGAEIWREKNNGDALSAKNKLEVFSGSIAPGNHLLTVFMVYRGHSSVFTYIEGLVVRLSEKYSFPVESGKQVTVHAIGYDRAGVTAQLRDRPAVRFDSQDEALRDVEDAGAVSGAAP